MNNALEVSCYAARIGRTVSLKWEMFFYNQFTAGYLEKLAKKLWKGPALVLMYHGVVPDTFPVRSWLLVKESVFAWQMEFLKSHFNVIPGRELTRRVKSRDDSDRMAVVITFDDGYVNNYTVVYPLLRKYDIPASFFITSGAIDTKELFWFDKVILPIQYSDCSHINLSRYGLGRVNFSRDSIEKRWTDLQSLLALLKQIEYSKMLEIVEYVADTYRIPDEVVAPLLPLESNHVVEMSESDLIDIGSHTHNHRILSQIQEDQVEREIKLSVDLLENMCGSRIEMFSFPNGQSSEIAIKALRKYGIKQAFITRSGYYKSTDDPLAIPRIGISGFDSKWLFKAKMLGVRQLMQGIYQRWR